MNILVTGSSGLIGSEAVEFYDAQGDCVWGVDNNMRRDLFGPQGDTLWNLARRMTWGAVRRLVSGQLTRDLARTPPIR